MERTAAENISYGKKDPRGVVIQLAIDDGVYSRGHLKNMVNPQLAKMGCNTGYHKRYK